MRGFPTPTSACEAEEPTDRIGLRRDVPYVQTEVVVPRSAKMGSAQDSHDFVRPGGIGLARPKMLDSLLVPKPVYKLRVQAIMCADDDGSNAATGTPEGIAERIRLANLAWHIAGIEFVFDPERDVTTRNDTLLNRDWTLADGADLSDPDNKPEVDTTPHHESRTAVAHEYTGRIVVFFRRGEKLVWTGGGWGTDSTGGFSGPGYDYVAMPGSGGHSTLLAHELGHYLYCPHTHSDDDDKNPQDMADLQQIVRDWVLVEGHPKSEGLLVFDGDLPKIGDTPPDPRGAIWNEVHGDKCGPEDELEFWVDFDDGAEPTTYVLRPQRWNIMSYFKGCPGPKGITRGQANEARRCLVEEGNRRHLVRFLDATDDLPDWVEQEPQPQG